jgi:hypothetical protein
VLNVRDSFERCIQTVIGSGLNTDRIHVPIQVHIKQGKTDKDIPNHQHVFVITKTEEERRSLFEAFTKAYGAQTMGLYKPIDKNL